MRELFRHTLKTSFLWISYHSWQETCCHLSLIQVGVNVPDTYYQHFAQYFLLSQTEKKKHQKDEITQHILARLFYKMDCRKSTMILITLKQSVILYVSIYDIVSYNMTQYCIVL